MVAVLIIYPLLFVDIDDFVIYPIVLLLSFLLWHHVYEPI